jgi:arogenate dehydrogenase (NADP+)
MRIGIVGLGLIGGSLGLDLRQLGHTVLGVSRQAHTCERALELGAVDEASPDARLLAQAELIFLATPLDVMGKTTASLLPYLSPETILSDVGSVKAPVVAEQEALWSPFVGGHPMAGTSESGIEAAQRQLFQGRPYVLTPTDRTPARAIATVAEIAASLGATVLQCDAATHDQAVAWISHLPVMVSAALLQACLAEPNVAIRQMAEHLASSGFRDTSRVGGGNPELGVMMARFNREALLACLTGYRQQLDQLTQLIEQQDWSTLEALLQTNGTARPRYLKPD